MKMQTEPLQSICLQGAGFVGAANCVAKLKQKASESAHTASRYTDKMNPVMLTREKSGQVECWTAIGGPSALFRGELHELCISPW